jgi:hypothetical protein
MGMEMATDTTIITAITIIMVMARATESIKNITGRSRFFCGVTPAERLAFFCFTRSYFL